MTTADIDGVQGIDTEIEVDLEADEDVEDSASESSNNSPQFTRSRLLNTYHLIRREAAPIYSYRLTVIAIELPKETRLLPTDEQELKDAYAHSPWLRKVVMKGSYGVSVQTRMCMDVMDDESRVLGLRLGIGAVQGEETNAKLEEALEKYEVASSMLFEVPLGVGGHVLILPTHG